MSDRRRFMERLIEVVHDQIERAEEIGLKKLDELDKSGRREYDKAVERHEKRVDKLDRDRTKLERRNARREQRSGGRKRTRRRVAADLGDVLRAARPAVPPVPPVPPTPPVAPVPPTRHRGDKSKSKRKRRREPPTPEERAYAMAKRRANRLLAFYTHFATYAGVLLILLVTTRSFRVVMIVAMAWGIGLFLHYFWTLSAPKLRERWIQREVGSQLPQDVGRVRVAAEDRHVQTMEDLSASIAHEIRNPITAAKSLVQQMGEDPVAPENIDYASVALEELDRVERSISHLLRYAREEDLRFAPLAMADVIDSALETFRDRLNRSTVDLQVQLDTRGGMRGDADKLRRVVINLVGNALDAFDEADTTTPVLHVMSGDNLAGDEVWVRVRDNGPGIDDETLGKVWSPFYTTKESGTGLGLALSRKVVDAHGGRMQVSSTHGEGTEFVLTFPKEAQPREIRHEI